SGFIFMPSLKATDIIGPCKG
uniref:Uncharacterized protein n=1 Tax=Amphimedon queenslandica TaxID=400682 RepID=A0A1X7VCL6_AMPQE